MGNNVTRLVAIEFPACLIFDFMERHALRGVLFTYTRPIDNISE
jgi:hypothetical protein